LTNRGLLEEALKVVAAADEAGRVVRLAGSAAVLAHAPSAEALYERAGRQVHDIDLVTTSKVKTQQIERLLRPLGFEPFSHHNVWHGETRQMFDRADGIHVDVFRDDLNFCHPISLRRRLETDHPTIPLPELLLAKLQIVELTEKDRQDVAALLLDHPLGESRDEVDGSFLSRTLAGDWGFWFTATTNLRNVREHLSDALLGDVEQETVRARLVDLEERIEEEPKTGRWKLRARVGTRKRWYQEVEEVQR
jgi:hypothetical protein